MKRVLVIAWFFPPCNLTASQRSKAWAEYFWLKGIYPVIVTRNWDREIHHLDDVNMPVGKEIKIEKNGKYEAHFLPYQPSVFSRLLSSPFGQIKVIKYFFLILSILLEHIFTSLSEYKCIFKYVKNYVKDNRDIEIVIVSGAPFHLFKLGHILAKQFGMKFIADYRDAWTDNEIIVLKNSLLDKLKRTIDRYYEKKWLQSATFFTTVSSYLKKLIGNTVQKEGAVIYNGFFEEEFKFSSSKNEGSNQFTLLYSGSLYYKFQSLAILSEGVKLLDEKFKEAREVNNLKIVFLGAGWDVRARIAIEQAFHQTPNLVSVTSRIPKSEAISQLVNADCFLMISYNESKGIISSKLFEYLYLKKPILNAPPDNDIVQEVTHKAGVGLNVYSANEVCETLWQLLHNNVDHLNLDDDYIQSFSRKDQTEIFAQLLIDLQSR